MPRPPLLLTVGEPAGIGPDCIVRAWHAEPDLFADTVVVCPPSWLSARAEQIGMPLSVRDIATLEQAPCSPTSLCCWNPYIDAQDKVIPGHPSTHTAPAVIDCIGEAARACMQGKARALVTGPIEKAVLREAGFAFPGHTEFLAEIADVPHVVMMLAGASLRVALLTTHMALKDVPAALSVATTLETMRVTATALVHCFGIPSPRLGLCGLNPHAGERGHFGREEVEILAPAAELARQEGIDVEGPLPADTLFAAPMRVRFDTIVCCYHDQGLIPIKALDFGSAVNITLGLPFVRTSVDHGTALARAATDEVSYSSLMNAMRMAAEMSQGTAGAAQ